MFNILNSNAAQTQDRVTGLKPVVVDGTTSQVPRFLYPTVIISPRIMRFGVKVGF